MVNAPSAEVQHIVAQGKEAAKESLKPQNLKSTDDRERYRRIMSLQKLRLKTTEDIRRKVPADMLEEQDGVLMYEGKVIVAEDLRAQVLAQLWRDMPSSTGRIR